MSKLRTLLTGLAALAGIVAVVAGVPALLYAMLGSPVPTGLPGSLEELQAIVQNSGDGTLLIGLFKYVAWLAWLSFTASIAVQLVSQMRHVRAPQIHGLVATRAAGRMVAAVLAIGAIVGATTIVPAIHADAAGSGNTPPKAGPVATAPQAAGRQQMYATGQTAAADSGTTTTRQVTEQVPHQVTVHKGDTLSGIAQREYHNANQWPIIFKANKGAKQDGGTLRNPNLIKVGLKLSIPGKTDTVTHTVTDPGPASPAPAPAPPAAPTPSSSPSQPPSQAPVVAPALAAPAQTAPAQTAPAQTPATGTGTAAGAASTPPRSQSSGAPDHSSITGDGVRKGTGSSTDATAALTSATASPIVRTVTGLGTLAAAGIVALLAVRRRRQSRDRRPGQRINLPTGAAALAEAQLRAAADPITVAELDRTLRTLSQHCTIAGLPVPELRAARITVDAVELYLVDDNAVLPEPFDPIPGAPGTWSLDRGHFDQVLLTAKEAKDVPAPYPTLVTLGQDNDGGHLLVNLEQLRTLAITGPHAADALTAITLELIACQWADDAVITVVGVMRDVVEAVSSDRVTYLDDLEQILTALEHTAGVDRQAMADSGANSPENARAAGVHSDYVTPRLIITGDPPTREQRDRIQALLDADPRVAIAALVSQTEPLGPWHLDVQRPDQATLHPAEVELTPQHLSDEDLQHLLDLFRAADKPHHDGPDWTTHLITEDQLADLDTLAELATATAEDDEEGVEANTSAHLDDVAQDGSSHGQVAVVDQDAVVDAVATQDAKAEPDELTTSGERSRSDSHAGLAASISRRQLLPTDRAVLRLLGPVRVDTAPGAEPTSPWMALRLLVFLALHPGGHSPEYDQAVWQKPKQTKTRSNLTNLTRNWIGNAPDGHPYVAEWTKARGYRLTEDMAIDWNIFRATAGRNLARATTEDLLDALTLVYGPPLAGDTQNLSTQLEMTQTIADVAHEAACRELNAGQPGPAAWAAAKGIDVDPGNEKLWRLLIRATSLLGDRERLTGVIRQLDEVMEPDSDLEQETEQLIADVTWRASA